MKLFAITLVFALAFAAFQGRVVGNGVIYTLNMSPVVPVNCHMNGVTDDQPCLQAAVNQAAAQNVVNGITYGAPVSIPCGVYAVNSPITLPRSALLAYPFGVVPITGMSYNCVRIMQLASFPIARGTFEWQSVAERTLGQEIGNMTVFIHDGSYGMNYQPSPANTPITIGNVTNERMENLRLHDVEFEGHADNVIELPGDCYDCKFINVKYNGTLITSPTKETVLIHTGTCADTLHLNNEGCGLTFGEVRNVQSGGGAGGYAAAFQGRMNQTVVSSVDCNGLYGGFSNSVRFSWTNSYGMTVNNIANEGGAGLQILLSNSNSNSFTNFGVGTPTGPNIADGMDLVGSSRNWFIHSTASTNAGSSWQNQTPPGTFFRIKLDNNSHQNVFWDTAQTGTVDITLGSDTTTNGAQTCNAASGGCGTYFILGTLP